MGTKAKLKNVRLFFNNPFKAEEYEQGDGKPRYSATFGISKTDTAQLAVIEAAMQEEAKAAWPKAAAKTLESIRGDRNKFCLGDGDKVRWAGAEGCMVLASHRKERDGRPLVIDRDKSPLTEKDGKPYSGCYVNATVEIWAQDGANTGMRCGLLAIQFDHDGDSFSGASKPDDDDFEDLGEGSGAEDMA